jgi:ribosome maturation factor RimP
MRGLNVPSFIKIWHLKKKSKFIVDRSSLRKAIAFFDRCDYHGCFKVIITLDDDNGVVLQDCIDVSRVIENNLDREEQDFL